MTQVPQGQQAPAPGPDPAPPSLDDIIGGSPSIDLSTPNLDLSAPALSPEDQSIADLGQKFGVAGADVATTKAALRPVIEMLARGGANQQAPPQIGPNQYGQMQDAPMPIQAPPAAAPPASAGPLSFEDFKLGDDVDPGIIKAFKTLTERSNAAIAAVQAEAAKAGQTAQVLQQQQIMAQRRQHESQQNEVSNRAVQYLDSLASPKYGVGQNRNMVQTMSSENVMRTAGNLIRGMSQYGQTMPIEQVMQAAILMVDGELPTAAAAPAANTPALMQTAAPTALPVVAQTRPGSAGSGGAMMADADFINGARAILSRGR